MNTDNPFMKDAQHYGSITVGQLVEVVSDAKEFPKGLDTRICIGDLEGNNGTSTEMMLTWHRSGDVVLSIEPHCGNLDYDGF